MNRKHIANQTINIIRVAKTIIPSSKIFYLCFFYLKFQGIIILSNSLEYDHKASLNTYHFFQLLTYYSSFTRSNLNIIKYNFSQSGKIYLFNC